jgi:hypothetical protein
MVPVMQGLLGPSMPWDWGVGEPIKRTFRPLVHTGRGSNQGQRKTTWTEGE